MEHPKTISDSAFTRSILDEHERLASSDELTAAQREVIRELLGYIVVIRQIVEERHWQAATWTRMRRVGNGTKAIALWIAAIATTGSLLVALYRTLGG